MLIYICIVVVISVILLLYCTCTTFVEKYNKGGSYGNVEILKTIEKKEYTNKFDNVFEFIIAPTIYADIKPEPIITNKPYIETIDRAINTNNVVNINNNTKINNMETVLDRAERFIPDNEDVQLQQTILNSLRRTLHTTKIAELETKQNIKPKIQEKYFNDIIIKSDSQNVHETIINTEMKNKYKLIKDKKSPECGSVIDYVKNASNLKNKDIIIKVLDGICSWGEDIKECDVYKEVWKYICSQNNQDLIDSFFVAINDCYENNVLVCTTGRINRVLGSLILLDKDEDISRPVLTIDMLRKVVLGKSYNILQEELKSRGVVFTEQYNSADFEDEKFKTDVMEKVKIYLFDEYGKMFLEKTLNDLLIEVSCGI